MSGGSHSGGSHHSGGFYYGGIGGFGLGGFGYPYGGLGYSNYGLGYSNYGRGYSNYGLGYSNYGYYAQPSYSTPVYNYYSNSQASSYQDPYQYSSGYSSVPTASQRVTLNADGTPSGDLRPGMVLPDGAIVVSVGPYRFHSSPRRSISYFDEQR